MSHNHSHNHAPIDQINDYSKSFKIGIALNLVFVIIEFSFGYIYDSLALISDAGHNLSDIIGLILAWGASYLALKKPSGNFTYGFKRTPILAALLNAVLLLIAIGIIFWEAINRISTPPQVEGSIMMIVAGIGILINGFTTYLFFAGRKQDLNIKGAYLHMLGDTLVSVGVVISGFIIYTTDYFWIDPIISIVIAIVILWSTWSLLIDATKLSLDAVPNSVKLKNVKDYFNSLKIIKEFHHLHIWALSTTETALTVHLIKDNNYTNDEILKIVNNDLKKEYSISHATVQIEENNCEEFM